MRSLFLFLLLTIKTPVLAAPASFDWAKFTQELKQEITNKKLYDDRAWKKLLHYEPSFGKLTGQVDSENFYLSTERTLETEMMALIENLETGMEASEQTSVWCRFPARISWIKRNTSNKTWPQKPCAKFQSFANALAGQSLSLVFSSYYLNNPSSAFGHTFLRINKFPTTDGKRYELLDYGINYAANQDTNNPVIYTFKGLFGGFHGVFSSVPYYYKVREYGNSERRDLWEYELNFDKDQVAFFVQHIWELGPTHIDYWYLSENCSFHMLSLLEAVNPKLDLLSDLKAYVIPSDTLKIVWNEPGLVKGFYYRPSVRSEFQARFSGLNENERSAFKKVIFDREVEKGVQNLSPESKAKVLDAAMDWVDSEYSFEVQNIETPEAKFKATILKNRSQVDVVSPILKVAPEKNEEPHLSHGSRKWDLGFQATKESGNFALFNYKFALHDFLDPQIGYPSYAQITFGDFGFSYGNKKNKFEFERATLVEVVSLSPWTEVYKPLSWRLGFGLDRLRDQNCDFCHAFQVNFGAGYTQSWNTKIPVTTFFGLRSWAYQLQAAEPRYSSQIQVGPSVLLRVQWSTFVNSYVEGNWKDSFKDENRFQREWTLGTQWNKSDQSQGVRILLKDYGFDRSGGLAWLGYY